MDDAFFNYFHYQKDVVLKKCEKLLKSMTDKRCNVRHYRQWEAEMTSLKEAYRDLMQKAREAVDDQDVPEEIAAGCNDLADAYDMVCDLYLKKRQEIQNTTIYFETLSRPPFYRKAGYVISNGFQKAIYMVKKTMRR